MNDSLVSPSFLKQKARQLKKEKSLSQSDALNEAALLLGFTNYKNYLNLLKGKNERRRLSKQTFLENLLSECDPSKRESLAISFIQQSKPSFSDVIDVLKLMQCPDSVQPVCDELKLHDEVHSFLLANFLSKDGKREIQLDQPHFVAKGISLSKLVFELDGDRLRVDGDYTLSAEFEFELDKEDPISKDSRFNDRELSGSFEITIDRHKKFIFENMDGGWDL